MKWKTGKERITVFGESEIQNEIVIRNAKENRKKRINFFLHVGLLQKNKRTETEKCYNNEKKTLQRVKKSGWTGECRLF